jgi:hypothetical protein
MERPYKWVERLTLVKINLTPKQKLIISGIKYFIIIFLPIVILLLPENYFDSGESICLSKVLFNQECYACGLTKACKHLLYLNFEKAFDYNMISFIALPLVSFLWVLWFFEELKKLKYLIGLARKKKES